MKLHFQDALWISRSIHSDSKEFCPEPKFSEWHFLFFSWHSSYLFYPNSSKDSSIGFLTLSFFPPSLPSSWFQGMKPSSQCMGSFGLSTTSWLQNFVSLFLHIGRSKWTSAQLTALGFCSISGPGDIQLVFYTSIWHTNTHIHTHNCFV